jgi:hypothetical protein
MSNPPTPITPTAFADALKALSLSSLHLKVLELRNSIAHLDYSNEQLRPFALGLEATLSSPSAQPQPDQDCIDAIRENEVVIARMQERIALVRVEVEERGCSWAEFRSKEEVEEDEQRRRGDGEGVNGAVNGESGSTHEAWRDGTFQTGTIRNGEVAMDAAPGGQRQQTGGGGRGGGSLTDEELRRRLEEQLGSLDDADEEGMHL